MNVKRPRKRPRRSPFLLALLAGCGSAPVSETPVGVRTEVVILPGGFVRFEGNRVPMENFLLEMRVRVRNADGDETRIPWVVIEVEPEVPDLSGQAMVQRLMDGLRAAGVADVGLGDTAG